jgi:hypothetical protein
MITYNYTAKDPKTGQKIKAQVQAEDVRSAAKLIKAGRLLSTRNKT